MHGFCWRTKASQVKRTRKSSYRASETAEEHVCRLRARRQADAIRRRREQDAARQREQDAARQREQDAARQMNANNIVHATNKNPHKKCNSFLMFL
jgi:translation initiation factor IF-2